jgi:hypothetical protein
MKTVIAMIAALGLTLTAAPALAGGKTGLNLGVGAGAGLLVSTKNLLTHKTNLGVGANVAANVNVKGGLLGLLLGGSGSRGHGGAGHGCGC